MWRYEIGCSARGSLRDFRAHGRWSRVPPKVARTYQKKWTRPPETSRVPGEIRRYGRILSTLACPARQYESGGWSTVFRELYTAIEYSLVMPPKTGFRRIRAVSRPMIFATGWSGSSS